MKNFLTIYRKQVILSFLVSLWLIFFYLLFLSLTKPIYIDEGVFLTIGKGIAQGKSLYLDFWDHKTPGIHLLWSLLYPLFSTQVIFYKLFLWVINLLTAGLVYKISEKMSKGSGKFSAIIFLATLVFLEGNYLSAGPFLAFFLTLAVFFLLSDDKKGYFPFLSGLFLSFGFIFKQVAILNLLIFLSYFLFTKRFKDLFPFILGVISPITMMIIYLTQNNLLSQFTEQVFGISNYPSEPLYFRLEKWLETFIRIWWVWIAFFGGLLLKIADRRQKIFLILMIIVPLITFMRHYPHYWLQVIPFISIIAGVGMFALINKYYSRYCYIFASLFVLVIVSFFQNMLWFKWTTENLNEPKAKEEKEITTELRGLNYDKLLVENRYTGFYFLAEKEPLGKFIYRTEVNESLGSIETTFDALKAGHKIVILWPENQELVYSKEIGSWLLTNTERLNYYPELDLVIYYKD